MILPNKEEASTMLLSVRGGGTFLVSMSKENGAKIRFTGGVVCAGGFQFSSKAQLPTLRVKSKGRLATALLDFGCSRSIASPSFVLKGELNKGREEITMMNGERAMCVGHSIVEIVVERKTLTLDCLVSKIIPVYDALLGMDVVGMLGGVSNSCGGHRIRFCDDACLASLVETERICD